MTPIWKDYPVDLTGELIDGAVSFAIEIDGTTVYNGRAVADPDGHCIIYPNSIVADYLRHRLPTIGYTLVYPTQEAVEAVIYANGIVIDNVTFVNNWNYDYEYTDTAFPSEPVTDVVDCRAPMFISMLGSTSVNINGTDTHYSMGDSSVLVIRANRFEEGSTNTITLGDREWTFKAERTCAKFALLYTNELGGWDSLLVSPIDTKTDTYTRHEQGVDYYNGFAATPGAKNYTTGIKRSWALHTGNLTDAQASRMHHFLGSTCVYLYNLETAEILPVLVKEGSFTYKTFRNQGGERVDYSFTVELAKDLIRR